MTDGVRRVFKILILVPCIIFVSYLIFNIFSFTFTYFRLLGFANTVRQVAVENNYLPEQELQTLQNYLDDITNTGVVDSASIIVYVENEDGSVSDASIRQQYGEAVTVGVQAHYRFVMPLTPKEQFTNTNDTLDGLNGSGFGGYASGDILEERRKQYEENPSNNIIIKYTVPGLKYYPDLN